MSDTAIKLRSPYYIKTTDTANTHYVALGLRFWQGPISPIPGSYNYNLTKFAVDNQEFVIFEIASLARDYLKLKYSGTYTEDYGLWIRYDYTAFDVNGTALLSFGETLLGSDGYTEFEDGLNYLPSLQDVLISNRCLQIPVNEKTCIPINGFNTTAVKFYSGGVLVKNQGITYNDTSANSVRNICYEVDQDDYYGRVANIPNSSFVRSSCVDAFYGTIDYGAVDTIVVDNQDPNVSTTINVTRTIECRYPINKLSFVNKYGAIQDLFLFKKSEKQLNVSDTTFKRNLLAEADFNYDTTEHQKRTILKQGNKSITLNSGYINECLNPAFEELFLSEQVWLTDNTDNIRPVYLQDKSFKYKTHLNEKLINYTLLFEFAFDQINNIR